MKNESDKLRLAALLLCYFFCLIGVHRFYVGKVGSGVAQILTFGGFFGIWPFIDFILILCGIFKDKDGRLVIKWMN